MNMTKQPNIKQRKNTRSVYGCRDKHYLFLLQWEKNPGPSTNQAETMLINSFSNYRNMLSQWVTHKLKLPSQSSYFSFYFPKYV